MFVIHYINRSVIYPLRLSEKSKPMPLLVVFCAFVFCTVNGYLQSQSLCQFQTYDPMYIYSSQFLIGFFIFVIGMAINQHSDSILRSLRTRSIPKDTISSSPSSSSSSSNYKIPRGGAFEYISGAHYFGEIVEWIGYAIAANNTASWAFAFFTASNLIPRAVSHHKWYQHEFKDYPQNRKAVIPFLW